MSNWPHARSRRTRTLVVVSIVLASLFNLPGARALHQYRPATALGTAPNVLLILTDDQTMDPLSVTMPYLASKPRGSWLTFDNAFLSDPLCCPSRATILSGQYARHTGVTDNIGTAASFDDTDTIATWLHASGYTTGLFGKYFNQYPWDKGTSYIPPGWDSWFAFQTQAGYYDYDIDNDGVTQAYGELATDYSTDVTVHAVDAFIQGAGSQPFFAYWTPHAPHSKFTPAAKYTSLFPGVSPLHAANFNEADVSDKPAWVQGLPSFTPDQITQLDTDRVNDWRTLRSVDDGIHELVDTLRRTGKLDNTVIIFLTDNGLSMGSHRWPYKGCAYEECIRTPMMVRFPGVQSRRIRQLVSNIDLSPTILELSGATPTIPEDGTSLVPLLSSSSGSLERDALYFEWAGGYDSESQNPTYVPPWTAVRTDRYKYVKIATGEEELYDLRKDPAELANVVNDPKYATIASDMAARLALWDS